MIKCNSVSESSFTQSTIDLDYDIYKEEFNEQLNEASILEIDSTTGRQVSTFILALRILRNCNTFYGVC